MIQGDTLMTEYRQEFSAHKTGERTSTSKVCLLGPKAAGFLEM